MSVRLSSAERGSERLAERRRVRRRRLLIAFSILFFILCSALVYGLWRDSVRISRVVIYGADQSFSEVATAAMQGSYLGLAPRDSVFFVPESRIRSNIMAAHPDIAAVSIFRNGLTGLSIKVDYRVPVAQWCGASPDPRRFDLNASSTRSNLVGSGADCYFFDASGFVFATTSTDSTGSPQAAQSVNSFTVYEPWASQASPTSPIGSTLPNADKLPSAFDFARQLVSFGSPVTEIVFRDGEVDDYLESGTRITYVLGHESDAFTALASARTNLNLSDGSLDYVDMRFDGKVYLKKAEPRK